MEKGLKIFLLIILLIVIGIGVYYFINKSPIKTLNLSSKDNVSAESIFIEKNKNSKEATVDITVIFNESHIYISNELGVKTCYIYKELFFWDLETALLYYPSEEGKEYVRKIDSFLDGYNVTKVVANIKSGNGKNDFTCSLGGYDDAKNSIVFISQSDNSRYTFGLDEAREQYPFIP